MWSTRPLKVRRGEIVTTPGGPITASATDLTWARQVRDYLEVSATDLRVIDMVELKEQVQFPHEAAEVPRLLALVSENYVRSGKPYLARLAADVPAKLDRSSVSRSVYADHDLRLTMSPEELNGLFQEVEQ